MNVSVAKTDARSAEDLRELLLEAVRSLGGTAEDLDTLFASSREGNEALAMMGQMLAGRAGFVEFEVDYGADEFEYAANFSALKRGGKYLANGNLLITPEHFPSGGQRGRHERRFYLFRPFEKKLSTTKDITHAIAKNPFGTSQIHPFDLLNLCAKNRRFGTEYPLVSSFADAWNDGRGSQYALYVHTDGVSRVLTVQSLEANAWSAACRFPVLC